MTKQIFFSSFVEEFLDSNTDMCNDIIKELSQIEEFLDQQQKCGDIMRNPNGQILFRCSLCIQEQPVYESFGRYEEHLNLKHSRAHMTNMFRDNEIHNENLWIELKKMENVNFSQHSSEFLQKIDEVIDDESREEFNCLEKLGEKIPTQNTTFVQESTVANDGSKKKKKKRTPGFCEICHRSFNDLYNLRVHKMIHTGEMPFQCEECGKRFRQYNKLKIHRITHTNQKPHTCDICGKGFRFRNYLSVHRRLHSGENPYKCKYCNEHFHSLHNRRIHLKTQHSYEVIETATYTCEICENILAKPCDLQMHMLQHVNHLNFPCDLCDKRFYTQCQLKDHKLSHLKNKPQECELCHMRFQRKTNYIQHLKIHSNVKAYVCQICSKTFAQKSGLYGHMKSHSGTVMETAVVTV